MDTITKIWRTSLGWVSPGVLSLLLLTAGIAAALFLHAAIVRVATSLLRSKGKFWPRLLMHTRGPTRLALVVGVISLAANFAPLSGGQTALLQHVLLIAFVLLLGWLALAALDISSDLYLRPLTAEPAKDVLARKHITQVRILRRAAAIVIVLMSVAMALMTIPQVRQWGVSLLAAGGAAGIIVGLALQPMLSNLMAGLQLAMTQPIRLGDQVLVEGEVGFVDEITSTYVVVRIWDERRMVLPLSYFLQKPFQNWTRDNPQMLGTVMLYVDYRTPVKRVREKLTECVEADPKWDGRACALQVTDAKESVVELRCLVSAADAGSLFDLRCNLREQMIDYLATLPNTLPRSRLDVAAPIPLQGQASPAH